ncbi:MAG: CSLREA domain-containing protein [Chloroflexota bacterium]
MKPIFNAHRPAVALVVALAVLSALLLRPGATQAAAITYTVNTTADTVDSSTVDALCKDASNKCSLRAAIQQATVLANNNSFTIRFDGIGSQGNIPTIKPTSPLPPIVFLASIDGTTSPAGRVELDGSIAGSNNVGGLLFLSAGDTVKGLAINRFSGVGMLIIGGSATVSNTFVGIDKIGNAAAANGNDGIIIQGGGNNTIGPNNVLAGNPSPTTGTTGGAALEIIASSNNSVIVNTIGRNISGTTALPQVRGVYIHSSGTNNTIGGTGNGNLIAGANANGAGVQISDSGTTGNTVSGNFIGTNLPNVIGVQIDNGATGNTIGGGGSSARNVISGNSRSGIVITGTDTTGNVASGNYIGVDQFGKDAQANAVNGVEISAGAHDNTIGGTDAGTRNVISGNTITGISVTGETSDGNVIVGNYIGLAADGAAALYNNVNGIFVAQGADNTQIGGTSVAARNVMATSGRGSVRISGAAATTGTVIQGNYIGTDKTGTIALGDSAGIEDQGSPAIIGGSAAGAGNLISGNNIGIFFDISSGGTGTMIQGNFIGTAANGIDPLPNLGNGIGATQPITGVKIGGLNAGEGNVIAFNGAFGVDVQNAASGGVTIEGNSIHDNDFTGIDLGNDGNTPNDPGDTDTGANGLQNSPVLSVPADPAAQTAGTPAQVQMDIDTTPNTSIRVTYYLNGACDPSGFGEGEQFEGQVQLTTAGDGHATVISSVSPGFTTALATNLATGDTSEFSNCIDVPPLSSATPTPTASPVPTPTPVGQTPSPAPTPTPTAIPTGSVTPTPTPTSSGERLQGDVTCDGTVDNEDVVAELAHAAGVDQSFPACPAIGQDNFGDVDCDGVEGPLDALALLADGAGLEANQQPGCTPIGEPLPA